MFYIGIMCLCISFLRISSPEEDHIKYKTKRNELQQGKRLFTEIQISKLCGPNGKKRAPKYAVCVDYVSDILCCFTYTKHILYIP